MRHFNTWKPEVHLIQFLPHRKQTESTLQQYVGQCHNADNCCFFRQAELFDVQAGNIK